MRWIGTRASSSVRHRMNAALFVQAITKGSLDDLDGVTGKRVHRSVCQEATVRRTSKADRPAGHPPSALCSQVVQETAK